MGQIGGRCNRVMVFEAFNTVYSGNTAWEEGSGLEMKHQVLELYKIITATPLYTVVEPLLTDVGDTDKHWRGLSQMYIVVIALYSVLQRVC